MICRPGDLTETHPDDMRAFGLAGSDDVVLVLGLVGSHQLVVRDLE